MGWRGGLPRRTGAARAAPFSWQALGHNAGTRPLRRCPRPDAALPPSPACRLCRLARPAALAQDPPRRCGLPLPRAAGALHRRAHRRGGARQGLPHHRGRAHHHGPGGPPARRRSAPGLQPGEPGAARPGEPRWTPAAQRQRDSDARRILAAELKREEERLAALQKEYNNGEPERRGDERNYQRYLDRVAEMKAAITAQGSDIAALKRELAKLPPRDTHPREPPACLGPSTPSTMLATMVAVVRPDGAACRPTPALENVPACRAAR
jgi:hypothetical protein